MKDTLLVLDDDTFNLRSLKRVLKGTFDEMLVAQSTQQAEELLGTHQVTHVLCDRNLSESTRGEEVIRRWRARWRTIRYAALMTGDDTHQLEGLPSIDAVFAKPIDPAALREALTAAKRER
jgi:CheY-like chemotaxis protein